ncbi:stretch-activated Ca2+-permeable channel component-domain-containing protein [Mycena floridula]|nr:stretch-activated Ca2+-permeable channel component-domain-containing protein [Mycena floridula]
MGLITLLLLVSSTVLAQDKLALQLDSVFAYQGNAPPTLYIPPSTSGLSLSVALCTGNSRFWIVPGAWDASLASASSPSSTSASRSSSASAAATTASNDGPDGGTELVIDSGLGVTRVALVEGGWLAVTGTSSGLSFQVGITESPVALHAPIPLMPLLGDTTANQAILFSTPWELDQGGNPSYPNYTLPSANVTIPAVQAPITELIVVKTSDLTNSLSACAVRTIANSTASASSGTNAVTSSVTLANSVAFLASSSWRRDSLPRMQYILGSLEPGTNYTAWVVSASSPSSPSPVALTRLSLPLQFITKSAAFACPLVTGLPWCPNVAWSVVGLNSANGAIYTDGSNPIGLPSASIVNLPTSMSDPILSSISNFTASLGTMACGRDRYSFLQDCIDCQEAYRKWVCSVGFPRCGEQSSTNQSPFSIALSGKTSSGTAQAETTLLPCIERCEAVDRACPNFLGFKCPARPAGPGVGIVAQTYGTGYIDGLSDGHGVVTGLSTPQTPFMTANAGSSDSASSTTNGILNTLVNADRSEQGATKWGWVGCNF